MNILFLNTTHPFLPQRLAALGHRCVVNEHDDAKTIHSLLPQFQGVVMRSRLPIDRDFLDHGRHLRFLAREGVGTEHIDMEYARRLEIPVLISPEGSQDAVGEHALGMLLMLTHKLHVADRQVRAGRWEREINRGTEIKGKTVGIVGYGTMGKSFARKISGLQPSRVVAYDKYLHNYGDDFAEAVDLQELQHVSEIVSLHIPYEADNHLLVNDAYLSAFKHPIFLINTARGMVLNTADLVRHLKRETVRGAALDVLEYEAGSFEQIDLGHPPPNLEYLMKSDRVVLAPHIAGWTFESKEKHARVLARKIEALLKEHER